MRLIDADELLTAFPADDEPMLTKSCVRMTIQHMPTIEPEIIRCNSCKHWTQSTGKMKGYGLGRCDFHDADLVTCNGFCYWAERRNVEAKMFPVGEIIHCKDCKNSENWYRDRRRCFLWAEEGVSVFDDGFCNYAERKD